MSMTRMVSLGVLIRALFGSAREGEPAIDGDELAGDV